METLMSPTNICNAHTPGYGPCWRTIGHDGPHATRFGYEFDEETTKLPAGIAPHVLAAVDANIAKCAAAHPKQDNIDHPPHYTSGAIEVIEGIEAWELGFHLGNVVKYVARAGKKAESDELTDLKKAMWYLRRKIQQVQADG